jgi:hypothetical protein
MLLLPEQMLNFIIFLVRNKFKQRSNNFYRSGSAIVNAKFTLTTTLIGPIETRIPVEITKASGSTVTVNKKFSISIVKTGQQDISVTVSRDEYFYQLSTSGITIPIGTWETTPQAPTSTQSAWTRTTTIYSDITQAVTYTVGEKVGQKGGQGPQGNQGVSQTVTNSKTQYQKSKRGIAVST